MEALSPARLNVRLVIEYDGAAFHGYQYQPNARTVQEELQRVLEVVLRERPTRLTAAGRTDAGVHAAGQVVNFFVERPPDLERLRHAVSSMLRGELSVRAAEIVPDNFNSRRHATLKQYTYRIVNRPAPPVLNRGRVWHVSSPLNVEVLRREAATLVGTHDFTSLRASNCGAYSPVRTIHRSEVVQDGDELSFVVQGRSFLKQMVRTIVGTLVRVARDPEAEPSLLAVLDLRDRTCAGITAPAHGLCLDWVSYDPIQS